MMSPSSHSTGRRLAALLVLATAAAAAGRASSAATPFDTLFPEDGNDDVDAPGGRDLLQLTEPTSSGGGGGVTAASTRTRSGDYDIALASRGFITGTCSREDFTYCWKVCWRCRGQTCYTIKGVSTCYGTECAAEGVCSAKCCNEGVACYKTNSCPVAAVGAPVPAAVPGASASDGSAAASSDNTASVDTTTLDDTTAAASDDTATASSSSSSDDTAAAASSDDDTAAASSLDDTAAASAGVPTAAQIIALAGAISDSGPLARPNCAAAVPAHLALLAAVATSSANLLGLCGAE
jgi:hypothetical protein